MFSEKLKQPVILFLIIALLLCGCEKTPKAEDKVSEIPSDIQASEILQSDSEMTSKEDTSSVESDNSSSNNQSSSAAKENSSSKKQASSVSSDKKVSSVVSSQKANSEDPQNNAKPDEQGAAVNIQNIAPKSGKANGIDVSKWQGAINWASVKASGMDFAYIRIGYRAENGVIYADPNAHYNIQQADKAGILVGIYFFSTAVSKAEAVEEADWTAEQIKSYPISYPVVYDCEGFTNADSRMKSLTAEQRTENAIAFLSTVTSKGYEGMFYAPKSQIEDSSLWNISKIAQSYKVWLAHYDSAVYPQKEVPNYGGRFDMWQYTNNGKVGGIKGAVDLNVSYFTAQKAEPKSQTAPVTAEKPKEKDPDYTEVNEQVTAKEVVNLRAEPNQNSEIVGSFKNGEVLNRIAVGVNGWSKLQYNGQTVYAVTSYLTTDLSYKTPQASDGFTSVNEKVTAKDIVNLREAPTTDSKTVASLKNGDIVIRIGTNPSTGWSKLEYNGQTVYAVTSYLTTDINYEKPAESDGFTQVNQQVTAKSETNLRDKPSTEGSNVIYTLKNGEFITRTGINSASGWSKLDYNGQTVYAITSYLTEQSETNEE